jgi:hypothetical protein
MSDEPAAVSPAQNVPNSYEFTSGKITKRATFDPSTNIVRIEFAGGEARSYSSFTPEAWAEWLAADAAGQNSGAWYQNKIRQRPKVYPEVKAGEPAAAPATASPADREIRLGDGAPVESPAPKFRERVKKALARWAKGQ